jgi:hypothetical protein
VGTEWALYSGNTHLCQGTVRHYQFLANTLRSAQMSSERNLLVSCQVSNDVGQSLDISLGEWNLKMLNGFQRVRDAGAQIPEHSALHRALVDLNSEFPRLHSVVHRLCTFSIQTIDKPIEFNIKFILFSEIYNHIFRTLTDARDRPSPMFATFGVVTSTQDLVVSVQIVHGQNSDAGLELLRLPSVDTRLDLIKSLLEPISIDVSLDKYDIFQRFSCVFIQFMCL